MGKKPNARPLPNCFLAILKSITSGHRSVCDSISANDAKRIDEVNKFPAQASIKKIGRSLIIRGVTMEKRKSNLQSWHKGQSGNPKGRPKGGLSIDDLKTAVTGWEKKTGRSWLGMIVEKAEREPSIAVALLKKMIPDQLKINERPLLIVDE